MTKEMLPPLSSGPRASTQQSLRTFSETSSSVSLPSRAHTEQPRHRSLPSRQSDSRCSSVTSRSSTSAPLNSPYSGSLSALYEPAFKPYQFSHMYNSKYQRDYPYRYWPKPEPDRVESAHYAPIDYRFDKTTYQQHFKSLKPIPKAFVVPHSQHRNHKPHPKKMVNTWAYPSSSRWIWSNPRPVNESKDSGDNAPPVIRGNQDHFRWHRWYSR